MRLAEEKAENLQHQLAAKSAERRMLTADVQNHAELMHQLEADLVTTSSCYQSLRTGINKVMNYVSSYVYGINGHYYVFAHMHFACT